jgi:colanic acid/amylovoran biosynthesis protein
MKIVITGVTGFRNRGVEALVRPTVENLLLRYPDAEITIATWSPDYDKSRLQESRVFFVEDLYLKCGLWAIPPEQIPVKKPSIWRRAARKSIRVLGLQKNDSNLPQESIDMPFPVPDLILMSGGDLISSDYGTSSLAHFLKPIQWAKRHGVPCALIGQSIGKFKKHEDIELWRQAEANCSLITLREPLSFDYLVDELGGDSNRYIVTADSAFLLKADESIAKHYPRTLDVPSVAISMSESIAGWTGNHYELHVEAWVEIIRMMLDEWGVNVEIIPHVQESFADDRSLGTKVLRRIGFDHRVRLHAEDLSAGEFKGIISKCEMVVAERMHAAIAGFSSGICTVPIGYSIKARGITESVLKSSEICSDELAAPFDELMNIPLIKNKLSDIWRNRKHYSNAINASQEVSKQNAIKNFDLIEAMLKNKHNN